MKNGGSVEEALKRAGKVIKEALAESEKCPLLLEDTAGAGGTLGRSFEELATLIEVAGGQKRLGVCLDSCHLFASGYDVRTRESLAKVIDEFDKVVGCDRLGALHVNDSMTGLGSNRDRHTNLGDGEIGVEGMIAFLSEPRFEGLPVIFEGPGRSGKEIDPVDMAWAYDLRSRGLAERLGNALSRLPGFHRLRASVAMIDEHRGPRPRAGLRPAAPDQPAPGRGRAAGRRSASAVLAACGGSSSDAATTSRHRAPQRAPTGSRRRRPARSRATAPTGPTSSTESGVVRQDITKSFGDASGVAEGVPDDGGR